MLRLTSDIEHMNYSIELWSSSNINKIASEYSIDCISLTQEIRSENEKNELKNGLINTRDELGLIDYNDYFVNNYLMYMPFIYTEIMNRINMYIYKYLM